MQKKRKPGNEALSGKERMLLFEDGSNSPICSSNLVNESILVALGTVEGRDRIRELLGPVLPGCEDQDYGYNDTIDQEEPS